MLEKRRSLRAAFHGQVVVGTTTAVIVFAPKIGAFLQTLSSLLADRPGEFSLGAFLIALGGLATSVVSVVVGYLSNSLMKQVISPLRKESQQSQRRKRVQRMRNRRLAKSRR